MNDDISISTIHSVGVDDAAGRRRWKDCPLVQGQRRTADLVLEQDLEGGKTRGVAEAISLQRTTRKRFIQVNRGRRNGPKIPDRNGREGFNLVAAHSRADVTGGWVLPFAADSEVVNAWQNEGLVI